MFLVLNTRKTFWLWLSLLVEFPNLSPNLSKHWRFLAFWLSLSSGSFLLFLFCHDTTFLFSTCAMTALGWLPNAHRDMIRNHLINSSVAIVCIVEKNGAALRGMRLAIQAWIAQSYPYITYLLLRVVFQLYLGTCARTILFWARPLFVYLFNWRVHLVR